MCEDASLFFHFSKECSCRYAWMAAMLITYFRKVELVNEHKTDVGKVCRQEC